MFRLDDEAARRFSITFLLLAAQAWGAAVGGLFQRMKTGFLVVSAVIIGGLALLFLVVGGMMLIDFLNELARGFDRMSGWAKTRTNRRKNWALVPSRRSRTCCFWCSWSAAVSLSAGWSRLKFGMSF